MKVLSFGEILWDVIDGEQHLGGAPFNFAAHSAQCGNEVYIISRLGDDYLGMKAFNRCHDFNVRNDLVQWDGQFPTGIVDVTLTKGQPDYVIRTNAAYDFISPTPSSQLIGFDLFYFGSLVQRNPVSRASLYSILKESSFNTIFYDVNLRKECFTEEIIKNSLSVCTVVKLNTDEVPVVSEMLVGEKLSVADFGKCIKQIYPAIKVVIITAGDKGCYFYSENKLTRVSGVPVRVADAVGAGDAFSAAFMHMFMRNGDPEAAASIANRVGAFVASCKGAIPEYDAEIKKILDIGLAGITRT